MFDLLNKYLKAEQAVPETIADDIALAAGVILLEVAYSDNNFSDEERQFIVDILAQDFNLSREDTELLIETADRILEEDTNKWRYINMINSKYSNKEKLDLIEKVWTLIYTDDRLDKYEDHLVHRLSKVLHIPHNEFIDIKLKVLRKDNSGA
ncbi:MAG: TerB family tellurite resistance protein [Elusimicrobiota bacterium]